MSSALPELSSFLGSKDFSDVTIRVGDVAFPCHRIILASASKFFRAMLMGPFEESTSVEVPLSDIDSDIFEVLLKCMYSGQLILTEDNAFKLLTTSEYLLMPHVVDECFAYLVDNLPTDESIIDILMYAVHRKDKEMLATRATAVIAQNFFNLSKVDKLLTVPFEILIKMFQIMQFQKEPDSLLEFIGKWTRASPGREDSLLILLKEMNLRNTISVSIPFMTKLLLAQQLNPNLENASTENKSNIAELDLPAQRKQLEVYVEHPDCTVHFYTLDGKMNKWIYGDHLSQCKDMQISSLQPVVVNQLYHLMYSYHTHGFSHEATMCFNTYSDYKLSRSASLIPLEAGSKFRFYTIAATDSAIYLYNKGKCLEDQNFHIYDCMANKWYLVPDCGRHLYNATITTMGRLLYAFGGDDDFRDTSLTRLEDWNTSGTTFASSYDDRSGKWNVLPEMSYGRACAAACAHDGKLYVSGGFAQNSVEVFDPVASKWSLVKPMPHIRIDHKMISFNNHLWVLSGMRNRNLLSNLSFRRRRRSRGNKERLFRHHLINENRVPTMRFSPVINTWSNGPSLESAISTRSDNGVKFLSAVVR